MNKKTLVVQHNKIIEARYRLSVGQQRVVKYLVSLIEKNDEDFKTYTISVADLSTLLNLKRKDYYSAIKEITEELIRKVLIFESHEITIQTAWLSSAIYREGSGCVELQFSPVLKPFLLHLKNEFTKYELDNIIRLKGMYSIRLYELLKQYQKLGKRRFKLAELRKILMLDNGEYESYNNFKKWVLIPAQKELSKQTDISFTWTEEKEWRIVIGIEFIIHSKNQPLETESVTESLVFIPPPTTHDPIPDNPQLAVLLSLGVSQKAAKALIKNHLEADIQAAIVYTQNQHAAGKITNKAGFVIEAIKNGYRDAQAEERQAVEKQKKERANIEKANKAKEEKAKQAQQAKYTQAFERFMALPNEQKDLIKIEFNQYCKAKNEYAFKKIIQFEKAGKSFFDSAMVSGFFKTFLIEEKCF